MCRSGSLNTPEAMLRYPISVRISDIRFDDPASIVPVEAHVNSEQPRLT
ncbi:MAG TPA: hypothetical protein VEJ16_04680 [Alphaproteobacteria bacterium]|nr:hypothetical protein [Alphaproteobacteria bacterium]